LKSLCLYFKVIESIMEPTVVTVSVSVNAPLQSTWAFFTEPSYITKWSFASDDWHTPKAENDLRVGGSFSSRMEAKDGSFGFDFGGVYTAVNLHQSFDYVLGDGRKVSVQMESDGDTTLVTQKFEAEQQNPVELQQGGWQAILNNFKKFVESDTNE